MAKWVYEPSPSAIFAAMRRQEARLRALKLDRLRAYPCMRARTLARTLHGEGKLSAEQVLEWRREGQLIGFRGPRGALFPWFQVDAGRGKIHRAVVNALRFFDEDERDLRLLLSNASS